MSGPGDAPEPDDQKGEAGAGNADGNPRRRRWSRARRPEEKQERRAGILAAAIELLDAHPSLDAVSLSAIARAAGISKANVYRYFESREAILLAVALADTQAWAAAVNEGLTPLAGSGRAEAVADVLTDCSLACPRLCRLFAAMSAVLEHNVSVEYIAGFKREFNGVLAESIAAIEGALPGLGPERAQTFLTFFYVFVAGAWPVAHPPPAVVEVLARPEFAGMCVEFEAIVRAHARTLLAGLRSAPVGA